MLDLVLDNLKNVAIGEALFVGAYVGNMLISMWYNIGMLEQKFDWKKIKKSGLKILSFGGGIGIASAVISVLPIFANQVGFTISEEFTEVFTIITIIGMFLTATCIYSADSLVKAKKILFKEKETAK